MSADGGTGGSAAPRGLTVVVMGVSGCGKSTVGRLLAQRLDVAFGEGDDFHGKHNIAKMSAGQPLDDSDRWPWLRAIGDWLAAHHEAGSVLACSALKRSYRDLLREYVPGLWLLHLTGSEELLRSRVAARKHHFMPSSLERSQFAALEPPDAGERCIAVEVTHSPPEIVKLFVQRLTRGPNPH